VSELIHVTTVLAEAGLIDTAWFTEHAREKGSAVHLATQFLDEGDLNWSTVEPDVLARVRQYQKFLDEVKPEILAVEESVRNEALQYQGQLDRRVRINGREGIIDIKGPCESAWNGAQLAAYASCFLRPLARWNLYLHDDRYRLIERKDRKDWELFKAALVIAAWRRDGHGH